MKIQKQNGSIQEFDIEKLKKALGKANETVEEKERVTEDGLQKVLASIERMLKGFDTVSTEDLNDIIEKALMKHNKYAVAKSFIIYHDEKKNKKKYNPIEEQALTLIEGSNTSLRGDNANKCVDTASCQRDYLAGLVCKSVFDKTVPKNVMKAHKKKLIHFHDSDYSPLMPLWNCDLLNVEDMLKNGFQMGDTWIDTPKTFSTAANLLAQISLIVSGSQYGGQTISWAHLVPFVQKTREYYSRLCDSFVEQLGISKYIKTPLKWAVNKFKKQIVEFFTDIDVTRGIKTYQYQIICHQSSNGQTPFCSNNLNIREVYEDEIKDYAMIIEKIFNRRIKGVKNSNKVYVGPLFPKLLYWTCEGLNLKKGDPYFYLTELAAKCNITRCQPDINSEKKCREIKKGQVIPSMGCVDGKEIITYKNEIGEVKVDSFESFWKTYEKNVQSHGVSEFVKLENVDIYDSHSNGFVKCHGIIRNPDKGDWLRITIEHGRSLLCTSDHPLPVKNKGRVFAKDLKVGDVLYGVNKFYNGDEYKELEILDIEKVENNNFSYDVTTESDYFDVSGINSHNCRSLLSAQWEEVKYPINEKFHYQYVDSSNVKYEGTYGHNFNFNKETKFGVIPLKDYMNIVINFRGNSGWVKSYNEEDNTFTVLKPIVYGRFNSGVVTVNIPHAALKAVEESKKNETDLMETFYKTLDEYFQIAREGLIYRTDRVKKIKAKNVPIHLMYGAITRMDKEETVGDWVEKHPYLMSSSFGFIGLYETCMALIGKSNTTEEGQKLSIEILQHLNDLVNEWSKEDNLNYSIYGTPEESLTYAAALALRRDFGFIDLITDKDYVVNSYHVDPREEITFAKKLEIEGKYLALTSGGAVSYIEIPDLKNNVDALVSIIQYMHNHIYYAEFNRKMGVCMTCGYVGDITLEKTTDGNFEFKCPVCGEKRDDKLDVRGRICGYLGTLTAGNTNKGRLDDVYNRTTHVN